MDGDRPVSMDDSEIDAFLGTSGTCVVSLASDDTPYSIPISYGYDPDEREFYVRLGFAEESEKQDFLADSAEVRLVVYDDADGWKSVIATGTLVEIEKQNLDPDVVRKLSRAKLPVFGIWDRPKQEVEFDIYRLPVDQLTGRKLVPDDD